MKKLLVAIDGSDTSNKALAKAKDIGTAFGSEITLIYVMEDSSSQYSVYMAENREYTDQIKEVVKQHASKVLQDGVEFFIDYNFKLYTLAKKGNPAKQILEEIDNADYDLMIIGSRGLGPFTRAVMGSVSHKVVNDSKISVLVVK